MPLHIVQNDITKMEVDAIVNAANSSLSGDGGVDGCIHRAAESELMNECKTGGAKITGAVKLPCRYVIHAVAPRRQDGRNGERDKLVSFYRTSLELAKANGCETVAFPLISSGIYGYPKAQALNIAVETISNFLLENEMTVYIVIFDANSIPIDEKLFAAISEYIDNRLNPRLKRITEYNFKLQETECSICGLSCPAEVSTSLDSAVEQHFLSGR